MFYSHACREKCLRSVFPADRTGGVTDEPKDVTTGRVVAEAAAAEELEDSPPSPNRCWMEWSWKHGSESRTEAAREILWGGRDKRGGRKQHKVLKEAPHIIKHRGMKLLYNRYKRPGYCSQDGWFWHIPSMWKRISIVYHSQLNIFKFWTFGLTKQHIWTSHWTKHKWTDQEKSLDMNQSRNILSWCRTISQPAE